MSNSNLIPNSPNNQSDRRELRGTNSSSMNGMAKRIQKKVKRQVEDGSGSEDEDNKSSMFSDMRSTVTKGARERLKAVKHKVSQQRGRMVKVMYRRFPKMRERIESQFTDSTAATAALPQVPETYPPLSPLMRGSWVAVDSRKISEDLHRLVSRVTVITSGQRELLLAPPKKEDRKTNEDIARAVLKLIEVLVRRLERHRIEDMVEKFQSLLDEYIPTESEKAAAVKSKKDSDAGNEGESEGANKADLMDKKLTLDLILFTQRVLNILGEESPVARLLRCVHQSMVLKPIGILRTMVIKNKMTKDVRSDDGWQIVINLPNEGFVQVKHVRKEQSVDMPTPAVPQKERNHWEYQWEVSMTFNSDVSEMTSCRLSITDLVLSEGMDPALAKDLSDIMQSGNLIIF